jgi:hypothetical protein
MSEIKARKLIGLWLILQWEKSKATYTVNVSYQEQRIDRFPADNGVRKIGNLRKTEDIWN